MRPTLFVMLVSTFILTLTSAAHATDKVFDALVDQAKKLSEQSIVAETDFTCRDRYAQMWSKGTLDIAWFYGYVDQGDDVADQRLMKSQIQALTMQCHEGLQGACGFQIAHAPKNHFEPVILTRNLGTATEPRNVRIRMWHSSLSQQDHENAVGVGKVILKRENQIRKTESIWRALESSINDSQVLIYDGHSRYGTGPGFGPYGLGEWLIGQSLHPTLKRFEKGLRSAKGGPSVVALAACESRKYYYDNVRRALPNAAIAVSQLEQTEGAGEQVVFGLLDGLLSNKCEAGLNASMTPATANLKDGGLMRIFGFDSRQLATLSLELLR